jgi:hypothetical protein
MPAPQVQNTYAFTLHSHPASRSPAVRRIGGKLSRTHAGLLVTYVLDGELERLGVPTRQTPRFADDLWRHTCFEMFVMARGATLYHEFNFSPSGEWAAYAFARYRERVPLEVVQLDPHVTIRRAANKLELDAAVRLDRLAPPAVEAPLVLGLSAVIEDNAGQLSYWALTHPHDKPDFHHPEAFALELDEIRH